ncbi:MAG: septum formation initiator [Pseudonocardiales bacterium]|nr:septum formation initiator [Pseudonocardiales bacterium]MBV9728036.1 septum formation initiator [Pseudonocardiales bacterium]
MTAPTRTATPMQGRTTAPARRRDTGAPRGRSPAVARAYARRAQRTGARHGGFESADAGRTPFVLLVMVLLGMALVSTLWLSTAATADSYHLQNARTVARNLAERSESLNREVATLETAPELARRARELGMVPAGNPARLIVRPDGTVSLIGQPRRATAPAPPPAVAPASPAAATAPSAAVPVPPPPAPPAPPGAPAQAAPPQAPAPGRI